MKRKIIIYPLLIGVLLVSALVTAGILSTTWDKDIDLTRERLDQIKESGNVAGIDIIISPISCDEDYCWATANQEGVINLKWTTEKKNCLSFNKTIQECLIYEDKTDAMLTDEVVSYVKKRLELWADVEINRNKIVEERIDKGKITDNRLEVRL